MLQMIYFKMNNFARIMITILAAFILQTYSQNQTISNSSVSQTLPLDTVISISLEPNIIWSFQLTLPAAILPKNNDLFILTQYPSDSPKEEPFIDISSVDGLFLKACHSSVDEFTGVCSIPNSQLQPNRVFKMEIYCYFKCELEIQAYISPILELEVTDLIKVASQAFGVVQEIEMQLPANISFEQIAILAELEDFYSVSQGFQLYANYGDQNTVVPNNNDYQSRGVSIPSGGKGIFISEKDVGAGGWIRMYLQLPPQTSVILHFKIISSNHYEIFLEKEYFDFTTYKAERFYLLNLTSFDEAQLANQSVSITFLVYSGNPSIDISFKDDFSSTLRATNSLGSIVYVLSPSIRQEYSFQGIVYISVKSTWSADYNFLAELTNKDYIQLTNQYSSFTDLKGGDIQNYIFEDVIWVDNNATSKENMLKNYTIRIGIISGVGLFGVRTCEDYTAQDNQCLITSAKDLDNRNVVATFTTIPTTLRKKEDTYYILFSYDTTKCSATSVANGSYTRYRCIFHIVGVSQYAKMDVTYTLAIQKRQYSSILKEGNPTKDIILKDEYLYYEFRIPNLKEVNNVNFFTTVIEGDISMIISNSDQEQYPSLNSPFQLVRITNGRSMSFPGDQLSSNVFYVAVYGQQFSQFSISALIERKTKIDNANNTNSSNSNHSYELSPIRLSIGISQQYTLDSSYQTIKFLFASKQVESLSITVTEIIGSVSLELYDSDNVAVKCNSKTENKCDFLSTSNNYTAVVTGNKATIQQFIILYDRLGNCLKYMLNKPLFVELLKSERRCSSYELNQAIDLKFVVSLPSLQLANKEVSFSVCVNQNCTIELSKYHHRIISKEELSLSCPVKKNSNVFQKICKVQIIYQAAIQATPSFNLILEDAASDIALFDGVLEKIVDEPLSSTVGRYFYYQIYQGNNVKIFFTSLTLNTYYIALHLISENTFNKNESTSIYLPYRSVDYFDLETNLTSRYEAILEDGEAFVSISTTEIARFCPSNCIMTISVFPRDEEESELSNFEVEVSQSEAYLDVGSVQQGYLEKDELELYTFRANPYAETLLTVRDMNKQSHSNSNCFQLSLIDQELNQIRLSGGSSPIPASRTDYKLYVKSIREYCSFQLSYMSLEQLIVSVRSFTHYQVSLVNSQIAYFLYYHTAKESFKIVEIVTTGESLIFVTPVHDEINKTIEQIMKFDVKEYTFSNEGKGQLIINDTLESFCSSCYYVIAVKGHSQVKSQIIVLPGKSEIPMTVNGLIKEKVTASQTRVYSFYSLRSFNISLGLLYGHVNVMIMGPKQNLISSQEVNKSTVIVVPQQKSLEQYSFEYEASYMKFMVTITATLESSYSLQFKKFEITQRIFEGVPVYVSFKKDKNNLLEYLNLKSNANSNSSIFLLIQIISSHKNKDAKSSSISESDIGVSVTVADEKWTEVKQSKILKITRSENSFNIEIQRLPGIYYIKVMANEDMEASVLLAKQSLTHLIPSSNTLLTKEGIFQLYSPAKNVLIEIFNCAGEVSVEASRRYLDIASNSTQKNSIILEQNNYGGHYVITVENLDGEYFLKTKKKGRTPDFNLYSINYYYFEGNINPYEKIKISSPEISYSLGENQILFRINKLDYLQTKPSQVNVLYELYVAQWKVQISQYSKCSIGSVYISKPSNFDQDLLTFSVPTEQITKIAGAQNIYFVGAQAIVTILSQKMQNNPPLYMTYDIIELVNVVTPNNVTTIPSETTNKALMIVLWILLPFGIAGVLLFFALRFCIKKYKGFGPTQLIEEDNYGDSNEVISGKPNIIN